MTRIGVVAYEVSADLLGEGLLKGLQERLPGVEFEGVVGERMQAAGCRLLMAPQGLAVMGLFEVLRHLPRLWLARRRLVRHFSAQPPDLFIGIDAPDFNLGLERQLKAQGIPTVHYVSPTFWAWRQGRVAALRHAADLVLSIFPFESAFLQRHGVNLCYVGHPLAQKIPLQIDRAAARARLGMAGEETLVALLPGSRLGEIRRLLQPFLRAAQILAGRRPGIRFVLPVPGEAQRQLVEQEMAAMRTDIDCRLLDNDSHLALAAADLVLTASGTATMEALLHKRPMVVGYRVNGLSYQLFKRLIKVRWIAMANLLANEELAPELLQDRCQPERIADALLGLLDDVEKRDRIAERYAVIHRQLRRDSAALAADAVVHLLKARTIG
jgi:lipid-A-disaccharide synthase